MSKFEQLTKNIFRWGQDRKIHDHSTPSAQLEKAREELEEMKEAIQKEDLEEFKDGIGDTYVCLVQACGCAEILLSNGLPDGYGREKNEFAGWGHASMLTRELDAMLQAFQDYLTERAAEGKVVTQRELLSETVQLVFQLGVISIEAGLTFVECAEKAYDEIKHRTGHLNADGVFVKDE